MAKSRICCHLFVGFLWVGFFFSPKSLFHQLIVMTIVAMAAMRMAVADMTRMATVVMHKNNGSKEGEREL